MKKTLLIVAVVLGVILVPVIVAHLIPSEGRGLTGVTLRDTNYTEIGFPNDQQGIDLAGMLFVPEGGGPFPAVVVIHGSGTSARDNRWYLTLTQYLKERGVVVLLPDKRGSEKSGGEWRNASFADLATDTEAAIDYLEQQDVVPLASIGIVGMSQGGWIAPIVADRDDDLAFVVSMVGAAVTPREQLLFEENHNLRQMGFLPGISNLIALISTAVIRNGAQQEFWSTVGDFDPLPLWTRLDIPALALLGSDDTNVPSAESAERLQALGNPRITVRIYEGSGHALESPVGQGDSIIRPEALEDIYEFIASVVGRAGEGAGQLTSSPSLSSENRLATSR